jgi:hypothetical protein
MNSELIYKYVKALEELQDREYLQAVVNYNVSPVVEGRKPAAIITLNSYGRNLKDLWFRYNSKLWINKDIKCIIMREDRRSIILFIYKECTLWQYLDRHEVKDYLKSKDYDYTESMESLLLQLKNKYKEGCPHEIGVFLGIPVKDVEAFVKGKEKPVITTGYWMVYYDVEEALKVFSIYDNIRERAIYDIIKILD